MGCRKRRTSNDIVRRLALFVGAAALSACAPPADQSLNGEAALAFSIGGSAAEGPLAFGAIVGLAVSPDSTIAVADGLTRQVILFFR